MCESQNHMNHLIKEVEKKVNGMIISLASTGIILAMLSILIVWTDFVLRLVVGVVVLVVAISFMLWSYRLWHLKKDIKRHFSMK